ESESETAARADYLQGILSVLGAVSQSKRQRGRIRYPADGRDEAGCAGVRRPVLERLAELDALLRSIAAKVTARADVQGTCRIVGRIKDGRNEIETAPIPGNRGRPRIRDALERKVFSIPSPL